MDLYKEILIRLLEKEEDQITFPNLHIDAKEMIEIQSYQALQKIKAILEDDCLEDAECFRKIEEIICLFEEMGSDGGTRHDFG